MPTYTYVPVIKGKTNDLKAVSKIAQAHKSLVKPLVEMVPVPAKISIDVHLENFAHYLVKHLSGRELFLDMYGFLPGAILLNGSDATLSGFGLLRRMGLQFTPTYGFDRNENLWTPLRAEVKKMNRGFCFRIDVDDLDERSEETWQSILERSAELNLTPPEIDLFIDLRYVGDVSAEVLKNLVLDFLSYMPEGNQYRSIILSGSSALKHVGPIPKDGVGDVERIELRLWMQLQADLYGVHDLIYSDYGVVHPEFSMVGPNKNANAKIRYTTSGRIKIFRGHRLAEAPQYMQYHALSEEVRNAPEYMGSDFSQGDRFIDNCADGSVGTGNLGTWVFVDMNHHIQYTAQQIQELSEKIDADFSTTEIEEVMEVA